MSKTLYKLCNGIIALLLCLSNSAQDNRAQYPPALADSYFGLDIGYIKYNFSRKQLQPGFTAGYIHIPHGAVRVVFGHQFNKYLSAELSYMRPVVFVEYGDVNGAGHNYEVGMNIAGLTIKPALPVSEKLFIAAEAGIGIVTRGGFIVIDAQGVSDAAFASLLLGAGVEYRLNTNWNLTVGTVWSPANDRENQPATVFYSIGSRYVMRSLPKEKVVRNSSGRFIFPKQMIQVGFTTNALGYGVNEFVSKDAHLFWAGAARVRTGFSFNYQRNIFHTRKVFSLDWGAALSWWQSKEQAESFFTLAIYPAFRFTMLRSADVDIYIIYSFAGPAFISRTLIDRYDTGKKLTFQDFMGLGLFAGKSRRLNAEVRIAHYSNGNIFPQNNGVMIPLTFVMGYSFN